MLQGMLTFSFPTSSLYIAFIRFKDESLGALAKQRPETKPFLQYIIIKPKGIYDSNNA